jgi:hypothetical protein
VYKDATTQTFGAYIEGCKGKKNILIEKNLVDFLGKLQEMEKTYLDFLDIYSTYTRHGHIFRTSTEFMGRVWRDWVIIDWGDEEGHLPCHLMSFIDLSKLSQNTAITYRNSGVLEPGQFAVVEVCKRVWEEEE